MLQEEAFREQELWTLGKIKEKLLRMRVLCSCQISNVEGWLDRTVYTSNSNYVARHLPRSAAVTAL